jgi:hypothetical protein
LISVNTTTRTYLEMSTATETPQVYSSLPVNHIRLVRIRREHGLICATLTVHGVDEAPKYLALSYTWGRAEEPVFSLDPVLPENNKPCHIMLQNQTREVSSNLMDFFLLLVDLENHEDEYIWIDAICINQVDDVEKAAQVDLMGTIYSRAGATFVWLGKADAQTPRVQSMIHDIAQAVDKYAPDINALLGAFGEVNPEDPEYLRRIGLQDSTTWEDWFALVRFLQRRWFRRVWTVQEVVLANQVVIRCGTYIFDWDEIYSCHLAMHKTPLGPILLARAEHRYGTDYLGFMVGLHYIVAHATHVPDKDGLMEIVDEWRVLKRPLHDAAAMWMKLLMIMRPLGSSDTRDRIFAMKETWARIFNGRPTNLVVHPADYRKSARLVFTDNMTDLLRATGCLNFLSSVQPSQYKTAGLPTWVADFAGPAATPIITYVTIDAPLDTANACKGAPTPAPKLQLADHDVLGMSTITFGTVTKVGESWVELNSDRFDQTLEMLVASPETYPDGRHRMDAFCSSLLFDVMNRPRRPRPQVFWNYFMLAVLFHLAKQTTQPGSKVAACLEDVGGALDALAASDPDHYIPSRAELEVTCERADFWNIAHRHSQGPELDDYKEIALELRCILVDTMYRRRTFLLDTGHFGLTSDRVKPGDTVRIVPDARALFTFRKADGPDAQTDYQWLIGETYVSGAMAGEATQFLRRQGSRCEWEEICVL